MPPWKSEPGYGEFVGHKHLTDAEIDLLQRWASSGAPEGDPNDLPPTPTWTAGWQLGQPDDIVTLGKPFVVPADGPNFSRTFIMPVSNATDRYVKGLEFRPGNPAAVHHANIRVTTVRAIGGAVGRSRGPSKLAFEAVYPDGHFLGWTPGQVSPLLPKGLAWRLEAGADLVVEIHFVPTGKPESVQPSIGLFYTNEPPERTPTMLRLGKQTIDIPAGQPEYVTTDSFVLPVDVDVLAVQPHAHYRAREVVGTATLPDGTTKPLIYIKDWDFMWQHVYRYVTAVSLPKGTTLSMRITYDNSADNPRNPQLPPVRVHWGQQSTEEMGDIWVQLLARDERDLHVLNAAIRPKHLTEDLVGFETLSRSDPARVDLHNDIAVMYDELGRFADAAVHFDAVAKLQPGSAAAHYNLGTEIAALGRIADAIDQFREALRISPTYALAHNNLGHALVRLGNVDEARQQFSEAARLDPTLADARYNVGTLEIADGHISAALDQFRDAVRLQPDWVQAVGTLAWILATAPSEALRNPDEAVRLATHAAQLTDRRDAEILDILAAAEAAAGHFDVAVTACEAALALNPQTSLAAAIGQRASLYKQRRSYVAKGGLLLHGQ
jgi:tetratricopeptide (TPR) repeat protein